jgi:hypothetical protein
MASFCAMSAVLEAQAVVYAPRARAALALLVALFAAASGVGVWALATVFASLPPSALGVVGHGLPAAFFGVGLLPQLRVFVDTWSVEGYSFGITVLDVVGSAANVAVLGSAGSLWPDALPFLTILACHAVLLGLVAWILATPGKRGDRGAAVVAPAA